MNPLKTGFRLVTQKIFFAFSWYKNHPLKKHIELAIIVLAIPVTVVLAQQTQSIWQFAAPSVTNVGVTNAVSQSAIRFTNTLLGKYCWGRITPYNYGCVNSLPFSNDVKDELKTDALITTRDVLQCGTFVESVLKYLNLPDINLGQTARTTWYLYYRYYPNDPTYKALPNNNNLYIAPGDIAFFNIGPFGHMAYVTAVYDNSLFQVAESNYVGGKIDFRTVNKNNSNLYGVIRLRSLPSCMPIIIADCASYLQRTVTSSNETKNGQSLYPECSTLSKIHNLQFSEDAICERNCIDTNPTDSQGNHINIPGVCGAPTCNPIDQKACGNVFMASTRPGEKFACQDVPYNHMGEMKIDNGCNITCTDINPKGPDGIPMDVSGVCGVLSPDTAKKWTSLTKTACGSDIKKYTNKLLVDNHFGECDAMPDTHMLTATQNVNGIQTCTDNNPTNSSGQHIDVPGVCGMYKDTRLACSNPNYCTNGKSCDGAKPLGTSGQYQCNSGQVCCPGTSSTNNAQTTPQISTSVGFALLLPTSAPVNTYCPPYFIKNTDGTCHDPCATAQCGSGGYCFNAGSVFASTQGTSQQRGCNQFKGVDGYLYTCGIVNGTMQTVSAQQCQSYGGDVANSCTVNPPGKDDQCTSGVYNPKASNLN